VPVVSAIVERPGTAALTAAGCGTAIASVCTIGLYQIERLVGGVWSVVAVLAAALCCGVLARALARLSETVPSGAGLLAYFSRALGRRLGLALAGPYLLLCLLLVGAEAIIVGLLLAQLVPLHPLLGGAAFVFATWAMCRAGVRVGYRVQALATWALVLSLAALAGAAVVGAAMRGELVARLLPAPPTAMHFAAAVGQALFLFMGFELVTSHVEIAESPRTVRSALGATVVVLGAFYAVLSLGYSCVVHAPVGAAARFMPQLAIADQTGSRVAVLLVITLSLLASFTSVNGALLALSRFVYALAAQRLLPRRLATLEPRTLVPRDALAALLVLALASLALVAWGGVMEPAILGSAATAAVVYAAIAWVRERAPFANARPTWQRVGSFLLAAAFASLAVMVLVDAGPARPATLALLAVVCTLVGLIARRRHA
jgi:amino acid transporter